MCKPQTPQLEKNFNHQEAEKRWYSWWEKENMFTPDPKKGGNPFVIVIPPPNITGNLHMGHALDNTLQDILIRYHRMDGFNTLWVPGTDHAGIATQNVVERALLAEGTSREALGRQEFIKRTWQWKEEYGNNIVHQLRRLGASCDWNRERFTLDAGLSKAVREVFVSLYEQGLIYQGDYIINWCPRCLTALADLEVEHEERKHNLYYLRYMLADENGKLSDKYLVAATTRPETIFGDTALAVNPNDLRQQEFIGLKVQVPLTNRLVPVIGDDYVDMDFGAGALKVTPAQDPNDFAIGQRHNLEIIKSIDDHGALNEAAGLYAGQDRFVAQKNIVQDLEEQGLLEKIEPIVHAVGTCYRCSTVIEPNLSKQWFVKTESLAKRASQAVRNKETVFVPQSWEKTYFEWMDNIRDWCISRQLWWGHQIPAWYCLACNEVTVQREDPTKCSFCNSANIERDPDVLDTWFSSALWPFSTLGWPDKTLDLATYYPTSVLVTGFDIIFFWVARMMMMGLHFMDEVPFHTVAIHALVRDAGGQKMSKSLGNVIDPLITVDEHGADAFRFTLAALASQGSDIRLNDARIAGYGRFVNKLWNAAKFTFMNLAAETTLPAVPPESENVADRWILSRLEKTAQGARKHLEGYYFDRLASEIYHFVWDEFCDWYLELIKPILYGPDNQQKAKTQEVLLYTLGSICRLLHPLMPFVTEELWSHLPGSSGSIMEASYPSNETEKFVSDEKAEEQIGFLMDVTTAVRQIRADFEVPLALKLKPVVKVEESSLVEIFQQYSPLLLKLFNGQSLELYLEQKQVSDAALSAQKWGEVWVPLAGLIDPLAESERLKKESEKLKKEIKAFEKKLANPQFVEKAPLEVVEENKKRLQNALTRQAKLKTALTVLEKMKG